MSLLSAKVFSYEGMDLQEQSVCNASTLFNVENNNIYDAYTLFNIEEQSIHNAAIIFKSFTKDAKLSCTLSSKWWRQFVDTESTFFKQLHLSESAVKNWGNT